MSGHYNSAGLTNQVTTVGHDYRQILFAFYCHNGEVRVYENGHHRKSNGVFGPETVFQIRITTHGDVQYLQDDVLIYTSTMTITWPLHAVAAVGSREPLAIADMRYLMGVDVPPSLPPPPPSPAPPPAEPSSYVVWDGGAHDELITDRGMVGKKLGASGYQRSAWSSNKIYSTDDPRKGVSFR